MYVRFKNLFINHRNMVNSISVKQLGGDNLGASDASSTCGVNSLNDDIGMKYSWKNQPLDPNDVMSPCGTYATMMPTGKYQALTSISHYTRL